MTRHKLFSRLRENKERLNIIKDIFNGALNIVSPRLCLVCNDAIKPADSKSEFLCPTCSDAMPAAPTPEIIYDRLVQNFPEDDLAITAAYSLFSVKDRNYMQIIHYFKYSGFTRVGIEFGRMLGKYLIIHNVKNYDGIIPIPIHKAKNRERGYNQSELIAAGISDILNVPVENKLIKRKIYTQTQTLLNAKERQTNVKDAFAPNNNKIDIFNKTYLLVDDVLTTGSTLNAAAETLLEMGCSSVDVATLAHA